MSYADSDDRSPCCKFLLVWLLSSCGASLPPASGRAHLRGKGISELGPNGFYLEPHQNWCMLLLCLSSPDLKTWDCIWPSGRSAAGWTATTTYCRKWSIRHFALHRWSYVAKQDVPPNNYYCHLLVLQTLVFCILWRVHSLSMSCQLVGNAGYNCAVLLHPPWCTSVARRSSFRLYQLSLEQWDPGIKCSGCVSKHSNSCTAA